MLRFLAIFFMWPIGYGWLWGRKRQPVIPDEIPGFTKEPIPRPDPFGIRPEMAQNEMPLATFSRATRATPPAEPQTTRRREDDDGPGLGTGVALGFLAAELLDAHHDEPAFPTAPAPDTAEWKGEGGQFSGGGASGSWEPNDPIDNHLDASAPDNSDVSDNSDSSDDSSDSDSSSDSSDDDSSGGSSDDSSDSSSDSGSDSSYDSGSDSSDSGSDSSSDSGGGSDSSSD